MQFPAFGRLYLLAALIVPVFSCAAPRDEDDTKQVQSGAATDELIASYKSFLGDSVFLFQNSEMYVGVQPIWEKDEGVQQAFVPTVKTRADVEVAECMHSAPPMDEYAGAIAFGRPPNKKFEDSFTFKNKHMNHKHKNKKLKNESVHPKNTTNTTTHQSNPIDANNESISTTVNKPKQINLFEKLLIKKNKTTVISNFNKSFIENSNEQNETFKNFNEFNILTQFDNKQSNFKKDHFGYRRQYRCRK